MPKLYFPDVTYIIWFRKMVSANSETLFDRIAILYPGVDVTFRERFICVAS
jgi:hypothetical protein